MSVGGSIQECTLAGTRFPVASDAEVNRKLGGFENEVQMNGDGSPRIIKTRVPFKLDSIVLSMDENRGDQELIQSLADRLEPFAITITYVSGRVYQGTGTITGEVVMSSQNSTCTITVEGGATLVTQ